MHFPVMNYCSAISVFVYTPDICNFSQYRLECWPCTRLSLFEQNIHHASVFLPFFFFRSILFSYFCVYKRKFISVFFSYKRSSEWIRLKKKNTSFMYSTSTLLYQFFVKIYELIIYVSERVLVWVDRRKKIFFVYIYT